MKNITKKIYATQEPSCGNMWCVAVNGWYIKENGSNKTFTTKEEAEEYFERNNIEIEDI